MCRASEAAEQRMNAARKLLAVCEAEAFGLRPALRKSFRPVPTGPEWELLLRAFDEADDQ